MSEKLDIDGLTLRENIVGEDSDETEQLKGLYDKSLSYIKLQSWCGEVKESYFVFGVADMIGIFLHVVDNLASAKDGKIWVVVGDIPSAYFVIDNLRTTEEIINEYLSVYGQWCNQVISGDLPSETPEYLRPTLHNARELLSRLNFIQRQILNNT